MHDVQCEICAKNGKMGNVEKSGRIRYAKRDFRLTKYAEIQNVYVPHVFGPFLCK